MGFELGFDIGGTFTDFALLNRESGELEIFKTLTTADNPEVGALDGLSRFLRECGLRHEELLNALSRHDAWSPIQSLSIGARLSALLTTAGFRDISGDAHASSAMRFMIYSCSIRRR